jgi:hypothetical protein
MKLTKRGESVFFALLGAFIFSMLVMMIGATVAGVSYVVTHERVIDESSCRYSLDVGAELCNTIWVQK